ncbi:MAG: helix-turn-helix domain-containing protein [Deltaproteobacteria bacterium]|nr:helix-turn-helix domain-containing protein [Deltaproteobacteria bacterium]
MSLPNRVRSLREAHRLTQAELAARVGVSRQALGAIEAGRVDPSLSLMVALAAALGTTLDGLVPPPVAERVAAAEASGAVERGARVVVTRSAGGGWLAHALGGPDGDQPGDGVVAAVAGGAAEVALWARPDARHLVLPGCAPILAVLAQRLNLRRGRGRARYTWLHRTSAAAAASLARGEVLVAGVHGPADVAPGPPGARVPILGWESGLMVPAGNPRGLRALADLARPGARVATREAGAETRRLLDALLHDADLAPGDVLASALVAPTHADVARAVALGAADVGFGPKSAAVAAGLEHVPLVVERFDLLLAPGAEDDPAVAALLDLAASAAFRAEAASLGYEAPAADALSRRAPRA